MIFGVDVSAHQGTVDFRAMREGNDVRFAIIKCTEGAEEGTPFLDDKFDENWEKLMALDPRDSNPEEAVYRGAYHFARYDNRQGQGEARGENEAKWFCKNMIRVGAYGNAGGCLPPALDLEKWEGTAENNLAFVRGWLRVCEAELGRSPMFYTGINTWSSSHFEDSDEWVEYPLWEVKYRQNGWEASENPPQMTKRNKPWPWTLWQWSGGVTSDADLRYYLQKYGPIAGVPSGSCDVNRFDGTVNDLHTLSQLGIIGGDNPTEPPVTNPSSPFYNVLAPSTVYLEMLRGEYSDYVARIQGLLMGNGYGPGGLVASNGLPDGRYGDKTRDTLELFKSDRGISDTLPPGHVTPVTWNSLIDGLTGRGAISSFSMKKNFR